MLTYVLHAAVLLGLALAAVKYVDGGEFFSALRRFQWVYAPFILVLTLLYLLLKGWRFMLLLRPLASTPYLVMLRAYLAGQAMTLLPGGVAARAGILKQVGVPVTKSSVPITFSSLLDQAVLIFFSLFAALWFDAARQPLLILLFILTMLSVLLGLQASRRWFSRAISQLMGRMRLLEKWQTFLGALKSVATPDLLAGATMLTMLAFLLNVGALDFSARGIGAEIPYPTLLLAFVLPTMLGRISALPGGIGVTEAGMAGILYAEPGVSFSQAAAAVAVFRVGTIFFSAAVGSLVYFFFWRGYGADLPE